MYKYKVRGEWYYGIYNQCNKIKRGTKTVSISKHFCKGLIE